MPSVTARLIKVFARRTIKRNGLSNEQLVHHLRRHFNHTPVVPLLPKGVRLRRLHTRSFDGDLVSTAQPSMAVLYIHGGAYIAGVTRTYHNLAGRLASSLNAAVYLPIYPFAPEQPFPQAINRVLEAYQFLLSEGHAANNIVISGDSAGGGLSLALLLAIRDRGLPTPSCGVLFSPGTDARTQGSSVSDNDEIDCMLSADMVRKVARIYVPDEADRFHPYASPCLGDYRGLPPLFITVASDEVLYSDAVAAREQANKAGIQVEWIEREGLFHVWPIMVPFLKEARDDIGRAIIFIQQRCCASDPHAAGQGDAP
ncbi:MAG: alpha/beta hydrolase fold domain-containing protein [Alcanivoracaceae bacterium]